LGIGPLLAQVFDVPLQGFDIHKFRESDLFGKQPHAFPYFHFFEFKGMETHGLVFFKITFEPVLQDQFRFGEPLGGLGAQPPHH
jgi:hypothetical protein